MPGTPNLLGRNEAIESGAGTRIHDLFAGL
jgi:hypothetical protein